MPTGCMAHRPEQPQHVRPEPAQGRLRRRVRQVAVRVGARGYSPREKEEPEGFEGAADERGALAAQQVEVQRRDLTQRCMK